MDCPPGQNMVAFLERFAVSGGSTVFTYFSIVVFLSAP